MGQDCMNVFLQGVIYFFNCSSLTLLAELCYYCLMNYTAIGQFDPLLATDHPGKYRTHGFAA